MNDKQLHEDWRLSSYIIKDSDPDIRYRMMTRACWALSDARKIVFEAMTGGLLK